MKTEELYLSFHILSCFPTMFSRKKLISAVFAAFLICPMIILYRRLCNVLHAQLIYVCNHLKWRGSARHGAGCCATLPSDHHVTILHLHLLGTYNRLLLKYKFAWKWQLLQEVCLQRTLQYCRATKASSDVGLGTASSAATLMQYFCQTSCNSSQWGCGSMGLFTVLALNESIHRPYTVCCRADFNWGTRGTYLC